MRYLFGVLVICQAALAGPIYKVVKEDGTVLYTDSPVEGSEPVSFNGATMNVAEPLATPIPAPQSTKPERPDYSVSIVSPAPEATIRDNSGNGNVTITASKTPPKAAARFQLIFDGALSQTSTTGTFNLQGINRGAHQYQVQLIDNKGKTLASTETRTLYLHQASVFINNN